MEEVLKLSRHVTSTYVEPLHQNSNAFDAKHEAWNVYVLEERP